VRAEERRRWRGCAAAATLTVALTAVAASASAAGTPTWKPAGNAPVSVNQNGGSLSCTADGFCLAVGVSGRTATWDGSWHLAARMDPRVTGVTAVSCVTPSFCVAVAASGTKKRTINYAIVWTGHGWQAPVDLAEVQGPEGYYTYVQGVSCTSATFCMAVGSALDSSAVFDGTRWTRHPGAVTGTDGDARVSCASRSFCVDLHDFYPNYWNGSSWRWTTSEPQSTAILTSSFFFDVSCPSASFCVATSQQGAAMWNGRDWQLGSAGAKAVTQQVSCSSSSFCVATAGGEAPPYAWNGSAWTPTAALGLGNTHTTVSCWAAGRCLLLAGSGASLISAS